MNILFEQNNIEWYLTHSSSTKGIVFDKEHPYRHEYWLGILGFIEMSEIRYCGR